MDNVRHESRLGRFSMEFFRRLVSMNGSDSANQILRGEDFEQLMVDNPQLFRGITQIEQVWDLIVRVHFLYKRMQGMVQDLNIEQLSRKMIACRDQLRDTAKR